MTSACGMVDYYSHELKIERKRLDDLLQLYNKCTVNTSHDLDCGIIKRDISVTTDEISRLGKCLRNQKTKCTIENFFGTKSKNT